MEAVLTRLVCSDCHQELDETQVVWYEVIGWIKPRKRAGVNQVRHRRGTGKTMCDTCMRRRTKS